MSTDKIEESEILMTSEHKKIAEKFRLSLNKMRIEELENKILIYTNELNNLKDEERHEKANMN